MPKISCILTSYDKEDYLEEAIESVLGQTYQDFELVIMDDGSTNKKVREILRKYERDSKARLFIEKGERLTENVKVRQALLLNKALDLAEGEYISYLCDDDVYYPQRFEKFLDRFESDSEASVIYCWWRAYNLNKREKRLNQHLRKMWGLRGKKAAEGLKLDKLIDIAAFMHKRKCLKRLVKPYWPRVEGRNNLDGTFAEKIAEEFVFYPLEEILFEHRFTPISVNESFKPSWKLWVHVVLSRLDYKQKYRFELD